MWRVEQLTYITVLSIIQIVCIAYIVVTGPIFTNNIFILLFEVIAIFNIFWTLWTIKIDKFSLFKSESKLRRLIPKGPYKYIRNPVYSSVLIIAVAMVINSFSFTRLMFLIVLIVSILLSTILIDNQLGKKISDYSLYKQKTYRLIPFIF